MPNDYKYSTGLSEYVCRKVKEWQDQKRVFLETKFQKNFEAVTNQDFRQKKWKKEEGEGWRSDTIIGWIRVKIWTFYSIFLDTVLHGGQIPFDLKPDPYEPEDVSEDYKKFRDDRLDRMRKKIKSQLQKRHADREYMKKWLSLGYYGMAFSAFDVENVITRRFGQIDMGMQGFQGYLQPEEAQGFLRYQMIQEAEAVPGHRYVSVWNMYWDMMYGNLKEGDGYAERIPTSVSELESLKGKPGYVDQAIDEVIREQKGKPEYRNEDLSSMPPGERALKDRKGIITRYLCCMKAPRKLVIGHENSIRKKYNTPSTRLGDREFYGIDDYEDEENCIEIIVEKVDTTIIRLIRNETGKRLHHMCMLEMMLDQAHGNGVPDNMEGSVGVLIGTVRAFEDNKKLSANVTCAVKRRYFEEPTQLDEIMPGKMYDITDSCKDVRQAILPITFPDVGESLISGIGLFERWKDDDSMIPSILQGFTLPKQKADTAYELSRLEENAGKYIAQAVRNDDEQFIEPEITDIYEYNMLYDPDNSCKVPGKVIAEGFTGFRNKMIRAEGLKQLLAIMVSSQVLLKYIKIEPHLKPIYEVYGDPDDFIKSEKEMAADQQQQAEALAQAQAIEESKRRSEVAGKIAAENAKSTNRRTQNEDEFQRDIIRNSIGGGQH